MTNSRETTGEPIEPIEPIELRDLTPADLKAVHALNQAAVPAVGDATVDHLDRLVAMSTLALVAMVDGTIGAFAILLGPGMDYGSPNYQFFAGRHADFTYVDRIAVAPHAKGRGVGRKIYEAAIERSSSPVLCAEVNVRPHNAASLAFHERLGFVPVGEQETYGGTARVRLLERHR